MMPMRMCLRYVYVYVLVYTDTPTQGTDAIIATPSSMAGYHVAEKLKVPFYSAFTMPFSRTRAFPNVCIFISLYYTNVKQKTQTHSQ